jgi:murein DD-endopeptidase MepM/ murein hydrolase activator NlpD
MQFHKGLDIAVAFGSDVRAAAAGTVIFPGQKGGYGNCVIVSHGNGLATFTDIYHNLFLK